ncbi:cysteine--tRNA ligase [Patescibacteria group bacterium]|nr:cysteine--tRNA ligase [Patescibacteria group bacterium]MBU1246812.1 cysteine--tRNA ligase [Patescibacteria group bacterium]MBU1519257.1 cysteine--tRNA ligase [Patescibacteria group bacterium]MBU1956685.1 cysteine--tRNA ligase [Patescibacteria group bacterium]MBU2460852.1 cysteine--tRNA ligase [Patescibacteria group bacterium]
MLKIYNTLTRRKEIFKPIKKNKVRFYQCGPTVYWTQHIGNLRAMTMADFITRSLRYLDFDVKFVCNYTDVGHLTGDDDTGEDKMEKGVKREGLTPREIADKYIKIFENDTKHLNIIEPDVKPRVTEHIQEIIDMTQILFDKGFTYQTELAIYFDISKAKDYTKLSRQDLSKQKYGSGRGEISDPNKQHPSDFALWFFKVGKHKNALQTWKSPWGVGFPGWHIECSVMAKKHLGNSLDIHMGGVEHIPIHHTNEIAQSESANGVTFVNYWIHNEHLLVNNKKMAKSEGTSFSLQEIQDKGFDPLALRYLFLQAHYQSKQNFTWQAMKAAQKGLKRLREQIKNLGVDTTGKINQRYKNDFIEKINNNFNFPQSLAIAQKLLKSDLPGKDKLATILDFDKVFGLKLSELQIPTKIPCEVADLIKKREIARETKNWIEADNLRKKITEAGYEIKDTKAL